jgi:hypothetical protein
VAGCRLILRGSLKEDEGLRTKDERLMINDQRLKIKHKGVRTEELLPLSFLRPSSFVFNLKPEAS